MTYEEWQLEANTYANKLVGPLGNIWDEDDQYDLLDAVKVAFEAGQSPKAFVREMFAEDLDSIENDELLAEEALENEDWGDEDSPALLSEEQ